MAVTRHPNAVKHTAAGDATTESLRVKCLYWAAPTASGAFTIKNGAGTIILTGSSASTVPQVIPYPFGCVAVEGLETDALTGGPITYILE